MRIPCVCVVALLSAVSSAQTTHVVGPGGFAQVNDALAVAAPGDEIVVQPGTYPRFTATIAVTIRAASPGTATIGSYVENNVQLQPGEHVHLVDLVLTGLVSSGGTTSLDRCLVTPRMFFSGFAAKVQNGSMVLQDCDVQGGNTTDWNPVAGLLASNATVTAIDSRFSGASAGSPYDGPYPGFGIHLDNSDLFGSGVTARGGNGGGYYLPAQALKAVGSSRVWVSDSVFYGGGQVGSGSSPVCPVIATLGRLARCAQVPYCTPGISTIGPLLGVRRPAPMTSPGAVTLTFHASAVNAPVGVYLSTGLGFATLPLFEQPILLDVANAVPFALLVADANGQATASCSIPAGFAGLEFWLQGVRGATLPLQLSPVAGGIVR